MLPIPRGGLSAQERRRISRELLKIQALADVGVRGTSPGSVTRYALNKVGGRARKSLRSLTPRGQTGGLRKAVKGRTEKNRDQLWYRAGYNKKAVERFQQVLAIEWGTRRMSAQRIIAKALDIAAGRDGERFRREFVEEMEKRIAQLAAKANSVARSRR